MFWERAKGFQLSIIKITIRVGKNMNPKATVKTNNNPSINLF